MKKKVFLERFLNYKYQLPYDTMAENDSIIMNTLKMIGEVHKKGTEKYAMFGWESDHYNRDSTFKNNLSAIFRHLFKIHSGFMIDQESGLLHAAHIVCRWQMATTVFLRENISMDDKNQDYENIITFTHPDEHLVNECVIPTTSHEFLKFITPETIILLSNMPVKDFWILYNYWKKEHFTATETARRIFINLMNIWTEFLIIPTITGVTAGFEGKLDQWMRFSSELIVFCNFCQDIPLSDKENRATPCIYEV